MTGVVLVSVALAAAAVLSAYRADLREALDRVEGRSAVVQTACGPIEYAEAGEGPAVLVVHGAGGGFDQGLLLAEELAPRGFRVVSMSRFGFLRTPLPEDASIEAQADAHACLMDALGIGQAAFIGASAGATSSAQMAIRHPDRVTALVLLVPALYAPRPDGEPSIHVPRDTQWLLDRALSSDFIAWAAIRSMPGRVTESLQATPLVVVQRAGAAEQARVARMRTLVLPVSRRREGMLNDASLLPDIPRTRSSASVRRPWRSVPGTTCSVRWTAPVTAWNGFPAPVCWNSRMADIYGSGITSGSCGRWRSSWPPTRGATDSDPATPAAVARRCRSQLVPAAAG